MKPHQPGRRLTRQHPPAPKPLSRRCHWPLCRPTLSRLFFLGVAAFAAYFGTRARAQAETTLHVAAQTSDLSLWIYAVLGGAVAAVITHSESTRARISNFILSFCAAFGCAPLAAEVLTAWQQWNHDSTQATCAIIIGAFAAPLFRFIYQEMPETLRAALAAYLRNGLHRKTIEPNNTETKTDKESEDDRPGSKK